MNEWLLPLLMIPVSIGGLLAAMALVHRSAQRWGWSAELQRKCVHVTTGLYALTLPLTFSKAWPVLLLTGISIVVLALMRLPAIAGSRLGSTIHGVERKSYGEILLAVAVGFTFFRSVGEPVLFVLPILVLTFADAAAALTGVTYGRRRFQVENGTKSLEGVAMFFLVTFILAMVTLLLMTDASRVSVIVLSLVVAVFGAEIEADSWRGFDNLFVPVGLHLFLQNNLAAPPLAVVGSAALYLGILAGLILAAPRLGLSRHAARGYGVVVFLILSITAVHNAILPLAAFLGFVLLERRRPGAGEHPDLEFLAPMAGVSALWLFLGEIGGHSAINLFGLTFAGVAALFAALAFEKRLPAALAAVACIGGLTFEIAGRNAGAAPESFASPQSFIPAIGASLALCLVVATLHGEAFHRCRAGRAFAVAMIVPLVLYVVETVAS